ncbi:MAG: ribosomal protein S18-alanine N-acetyltransferase [Fimbriimonadaceae bacterium]|nr:ribosomal protein S18-alanine N-acetyltransferase [Fimbriimonadaceae bacterium]QYK54760.1 MAG: ribosomal protein S18-alanine N-acetyltransferase [Fimbriimonadaceae bacterium]
MKGLRFEALKESHLNAILEIERASQGVPWSEQAFRNELGHDHGIFLVAIVDGKVVGFAGAWVLIDEAHVTTVAIHPTMRRKGLGEKLVLELLSRSQEKGATCATLEVRASNEAAIHLYRKLGFVDAAVRKNYYPDNREDALVMWRYELGAA